MTPQFSNSILQALDHLVVAFDREGRIVSFNRACEAATGYRFADVQGEKFWDVFLLEEKVGPAKDQFLKLTAAAFPIRHESHWLAKDGSKRLIAWSISAVCDEASGEIHHIVGCGVDITERREAEKAERERNEYFRFLVENAPIMLWIGRRDGSLEFVNQCWSDFAGISAACEKEKVWQSLFHPDDREKIVRAREAAVASGGAFEVEHRMKGRDGQWRWYLSRAVPEKDANGQPSRWIGTVIELLK